METNEHKRAGDQIRIETMGNPYLFGSKHLLPQKDDVLKLKMMQNVDGIPVPLDLTLSAGSVVALAGDYYTSPGWGLELSIPSGEHGRGHKKVLNEPVSDKERSAFLKAYADLASPTVSEQDVEEIYRIEKTTYIPFFKSLNGLFQQLVYSFKVKGYSEKLNNNEAHFSPWSARAYVVGHQNALDMAELAFNFHKLAASEVISPAAFETLQSILLRIKEDPVKYKFTGKESDQEVCTELGQRYHAMAVAQSLFANHFYSDHYAGGHLSRIGVLRKTMPERFGMWGSILINNMHNEDNTRSVTVTNPHQPSMKDWKRHQTLIMPKTVDEAFGDGTYFLKGNDSNGDMLVNGMTNSLGDIARLLKTGEKPKRANFGGFCFLPEVDYQTTQNQPLLLIGDDGEIYFRSNIKISKLLSPSEYHTTLANPRNNGYERLTGWQAVLLVIKLRLLGFIYSPVVEQKPVDEMAVNSAEQEPQSLNSTPSDSPTPSAIENDEPIGAWRRPTESRIEACSATLYHQQSPREERHQSSQTVLLKTPS
ncbi:hypothetical protein [Legionella jordanis]|uniref:Dot/Icm secretion system substrate n=1 Tax=Legionella jordanis TaxID=456 RepID=A0A0W0V9F4_9GAMM|nr:hypothetical protein [Legionella jordanis]KTD16766.1 Dot/Icm secretion system substrate [Legionella jordanis]RMX03706.1 hypothetical protein EAW55_04885 [Legionella jordanis]RMX22232.1 hypothetical protein EAS68_01540 [Legionella jordanis]VEH11766.1 Dot/Icm T4SS effector [Legionella jordanis]